MIDIFIFIFSNRLFLIPLLSLLTIYIFLELRFKKETTRYLSMALAVSVLTASCLMIGYLKVPENYIKNLPYNEKTLIHNYENKYHRTISVRNLNFARDASEGRYFK